MIVLILSHLYSGEERVHVNDFYHRTDGKTEEFWTSTSVPGPRVDGKDLYLLTSRRTGSAAEEFAYDVKNLKRGTLVGETTAGGANPGGMVRLNDHFAAFIANGRAINPVSHTNWEGVGVEPDVKTPADDALKTAHLAALTALRAKATDDERKAALDRALEFAKNQPVVALNLPGPGAMMRPASATPAPAASPAPGH
jgi:C-terminal processing protease CtpA/Prc